MNLVEQKRIVGKLERLLPRYKRLIYPEVATLADVMMVATEDHWREPPSGEVAWRAVEPGAVWGHMWGNCWFRGRFTVPDGLNEVPLFVTHALGGAENMLFVDGEVRGILNAYPEALDYSSSSNMEVGGYAVVPNHAVSLLTKGSASGVCHEVAIEAYAGHPLIGCHPDDLTREDVLVNSRYEHIFNGIQIRRRDERFADFYYNLFVLLDLQRSLGETTLRGAQLKKGLVEVFRLIPQFPEERPLADVEMAVDAAQEVIRLLLAEPAGADDPVFFLTGHSHMDTAWLWTVDETIRKCARTYGEAVQLMERYPEYRFVQSSSLHAEWMRDHYPSLFARMRALVDEGRYEPVGGTYTEPDCNMPGGESFVRNFLIGDKVNRELYGRGTDSFWLPDTFGYSAAMPQILKLCGIRAFFTSKLSWNDTTQFPYDTFRWCGIDGTETLAHLHTVHQAPTPSVMIGEWDGIRNKQVQEAKMLPFGYGDGGGGPNPDMLEVARRVENLRGCPQGRYESVTSVIDYLERGRERLPVWNGELYLELHRGTLTSRHNIKKGVRAVEASLRELEFLEVAARLLGGRGCEPLELEQLWKRLLINHFHDILPGTSLPEVHDRAEGELRELLSDSDGMSEPIRESLVGKSTVGDALTLFNSLSWERSTGMLPVAGLRFASAEVCSQTITRVDGSCWTSLAGLDLPSAGGRSYRLSVGDEVSEVASPFVWREDRLTSPLAEIGFDAKGRISSYYDLRLQRELVAPGRAWNTFYLGEDVPEKWDNWDIDADSLLKQAEAGELLEREVIADGPLEFRIRLRYRLGKHSTITQVMVFYAHRAGVGFETLVDWQEMHSLLKVGFAATLLCRDARHEIQFGHLQRPTHYNRLADQAQFERCQHRWSDLSENRCGVALVNDGKYGLSVHEGDMRLTLMKSGGHPDHRGDVGEHRMDFALIVHDEGFSSAGVIHPAYEWNQPVKMTAGALPEDCFSLYEVDVPNVIVEQVKPSEDGRGWVMRLYESECTGAVCRIRFMQPLVEVGLVNLLEQPLDEVPGRSPDGNEVILHFRPFEIKSLYIRN